MTRLGTLAAAAWMALGSVAAAGETVVVELFTSQGCSSCPPADRILGELADRDDVIALALHVDYWDYLGWKDDFASPEHTKRQRAYARAKGERTIYTPQMVIGGQDHVIGSKPMKISQLIQRHADKQLPVRVKLQRNGDTVTIRATARGDAANSVVQLVTYRPLAKVDVRRGENAGRTLAYHNIVQDLVRVGAWDGRSEFSATARVPAGTPVVVLVQARDAGPILGAARLR